MPQRKGSVGPRGKRHSTAGTRGPATDVDDGTKETSTLKSELKKAVERPEAVAIDNKRLREELRQRTSELSEATQQQTAISDILRVISNSQGNLGPVLESVAMHAARICEAPFVDILLVEDGTLHNRAAFGALGQSSVGTTFVLDRATVMGRSVYDKEPIHVIDLQKAGDEFPRGRELAIKFGHHTTLCVPLVREGCALGTFLVRRTEVRAFDDKHIALLKTFADQAVIAIENARLFDETKEALERQTATAEILKVIASSPSDVQPVFEAVVNSAARLFEPCSATITTLRESKLYWNASAQIIPSFDHEAARAVYPIPFDPVHSPSSRAVLERRIIAIPDTHALDTPEPTRRISAAGGFRSITFVPLIHENRGIGTIILTHPQAGFRFSDKQLAQLQTFADQAVIAIENARLFDEVQAKTRDLTESLQQQTATADVLKVISASPGELEPVFQAMLENTVRLCEAKFAMLFLYEGNQFRAVGKWNIPSAYGEFLEKNTIRADPKVPLGRVAITKQPVQVEDVLLDQSYIEGFPGMVGVAEDGGARTLLQVPMLKDNELAGTIGIYRQEVRPFTEKQIALVQNFAAQAVIAIENARLLNELRQRTDDLTESLNDLRTAQDRLVQTEKLASLGQLTAGIAHEIKNPLNFVNNFSALSAELTDELNDVLKPAPFTDKMREEVDELTCLLKDNLQKVVQHGKRADSIVKNMLLHSREGSGEHRPADINSLLDESLNLAYHGARAEKPGFNITLQRNFDADAGSADLFPQEITRAFLNLISNSFYAATKRKTESGEFRFEPTLIASTKNLGSTVEIRIRDNGTGIPAEVQQKMFNPFFTTKPAGEGTGLGLSMAHDIIVKQHGGRIDVATEPGQFTEFTVVLPRKSNVSGSDRGET